MIGKQIRTSLFLTSRTYASGQPEATDLSRTPSANKKDKPEKRVVDSPSFCMNLFRGKAALDQVFPYPLDLNSDRREMLQMVLSPMTKFLEEVNDPMKNDEEAKIPMEVLNQFGELGAFGALVPESLGGAGMNNTQMARLAEIVGANDLGLGVVMGAHQSIGYKGILLYGTEAHKSKYLPDLASGKKFAAFCLTEPSSGSDANSIRSRAEKSFCGNFYILNGGKIWISNGGFAKVFTVFAQTPVKQPDGSMKEKVSAFIVERDFGGVTNGLPEKKMGIKGSNTAEVHFDNVKIPVENLLGEEGEGFKVAMNILNNGRFGIPAACTGSMKFCIKKTIDHVNTRVQFGKKLREFGNVQEKLTEMIAKHYVTESIVYMLASNMDRGIQDYQLEAAIGKVVASDNAWQVCDEAIQLHGGMGFMRETELERVLRDLRIFRIFEGANDVMRLFVALTGMQYAGKHLQQLGKDMKSGNLGSLIGEFTRRTFGGSAGGDVAEKVHPSLKESANALNKAVKKFGSAVNGLIMTHKAGIIDRQYELMRVADAAIDIYSMASTISRCNYVIKEAGEQSAAHDIQITDYIINRASKRALENIEEAASPNKTTIRLLEHIAKEVCDNQAMVQKHPIDIQI